MEKKWRYAPRVPSPAPLVVTARRRAVQPLWSALDARVRPFLDGGVLLAVSGGPDSMALLEAAAHWRHRFEGRIEVAAVDHGFRAEAPLEVEAVRARALVLGFEAHGLRATPLASDEGSLRRARYEALWRCNRDRGLRALCTAHHADDDAEGLLLDLLGAGGGREGAAMAPVSEGEHGWLLRPFLELDREDLARARAVLGGMRPFTDPHDAAGRNLRARTRKSVWPALESLAPHARERFATKARRRAEDEEALASLAVGALQPAEGVQGAEDEDALLVPLEGLSVAVARRAVQEAIRRLAPEADPRRAGRTVERLLFAAGLLGPAPRRVGASFDLPGVVAVVEASALRIWRRDRAPRPANGRSPS